MTRATSAPTHSVRPAPPAKRRYRHPSPLAAALDVLGERWTLLVIDELLGGPRRYGEVLEALPGIGTNLLVSRLRDLEAAGVLRRVLSPESVVVYELAERGEQLRGVVEALHDWGRGVREAL